MRIYTKDEQSLLEEFMCMDTSDVIDNIEVANSVAEFVLTAVQSRLPQCGFSQADGVLELTRKHFSNRNHGVSLLPQFLFMINWADSAPGISWPESYSVTFLPEIEQFVVTASLDSTDMWGVTDLAIGSFPATEEIVEGAGSVIKAWWLLQCAGDQARWAYVWDEGRVTRELANSWADQVWIEHQFDEDGEESCLN